MSGLHPSLARIYGTANPQSEFLFIDESYTTPQEGLNSAFYLLTAVKFSYADLPGVRADLQDIACGDYWHTTEALQTKEGTQTFEEFLDYFRSEADPSFITCKTSLTTRYNTEDARQDCLRALLNLSVPSSEGLAGVVFEKRNVARDNNRDRKFLKVLEQEGVIPQSLGRAWVSPIDELALWAPDIVGMAYRRQRTHSDSTSKFFNRYLAATAKVIEI